MISANGHKLAFYVTPGRSPAIVLDAGGGLDHSEWKKVGPVLAKKTGSKIITYDRSGVGNSPYVPGPWKAKEAATDLAAGLMKLGVTENVILVSHSLAGEVATYLLDQHPERISAAVLVDANLPQFYTDSETARIVAAKKPEIEKLEKKPRTNEIRQQLDLAANYGPAHRAYHKLVWPSNVPATVITSAATPFPAGKDARRWRAAQQRFADAAPNRRMVIAQHSSHNIPADGPDVIVQAVREMVRQHQ